MYNFQKIQKPSPTVPYIDSPMYESEQQIEKRRLIQQENEREYQKALVSIKTKLQEIEGPEMRERLHDQIRQWFIECR